MNTEVLEKLGLTKNEIKIYLFLFNKGISTTGPIMKELGLSSSRISASLQSLIKKGLVTYFVKNNTKYYQAEDPELLLKEFENIGKRIKDTIKELRKKEKISEKKEYTAIFEGFNGFKQAFQIMLKECSKNDEVYTIGFSGVEEGFRTLRTYLKKVDNERNRKKISMKILLDMELKDTIGKDREKERFTQVRYLPKGYITPAALSIFKGYVIHWVWEKVPIIFVIKNEQISKSFETYFKLLWKQAKP